MMRASGSWDTGAWDVPPDEFVFAPGAIDFEDQDDDWTSMSPAAAGQEFVDMLMDLKTKGRLSARDVCVLSFFATRAGCVGPAKEVAHRPDAQTGHFQRHLDTLFPPSEAMTHQYILQVPAYDKYSLGRTTIPVPVLPLHEVLHEELCDAQDVATSFRKTVREGKMPPSYTQHRIVRGAVGDEIVWPIALYLDGVPFQKRDGLLALYVFCLPTGTRHLCAVMRKSQMCRCGCCGWCSIWELMSFLDWSLSALAKGRLPSSRHDGPNWAPTDDGRAAKAGTRAIKAVVVQLKGDWAEFVNTLGLASWRSVLNPCFCCTSTRDELSNIADFVRGKSPYPARGPSDYEQACRNCEILVRIPDARTQTLVATDLFYDLRKGGFRGRALKSDLPELNLQIGDRLEPSAYLRDISKFEALAPPFLVLFWRQSAATFATHRNPLMSPTTGISIRTIALDTLHTNHLGVYKAFCCKALWSLIVADVWNTGATNRDHLIETSVLRCRAELFEWYRRQRVLHADQQIQQLQDLRSTMLGTERHPALSTKAAETGSLLGFCQWMVGRHYDKLGPEGHSLAQVGNALVACRAVMATSEQVMTEQQQ